MPNRLFDFRRESPPPEREAHAHAVRDRRRHPHPRVAARSPGAALAPSPWVSGQRQGLRPGTQVAVRCRQPSCPLPLFVMVRCGSPPPRNAAREILSAMDLRCWTLLAHMDIEEPCLIPQLDEHAGRVARALHEEHRDTARAPRASRGDSRCHGARRRDPRFRRRAPGRTRATRIGCSTHGRTATSALRRTARAPRRAPTRRSETSPETDTLGVWCFQRPRTDSMAASSSSIFTGLGEVAVEPGRLSDSACALALRRRSRQRDDGDVLRLRPDAQPSASSPFIPGG